MNKILKATVKTWKSIMKKNGLPPNILVSLCISITALLIVFLIGVERKTVGSETACQVVSCIISCWQHLSGCWSKPSIFIATLSRSSMVEATEGSLNKFHWHLGVCIALAVYRKDFNIQPIPFHKLYS